MTQKTIPIYGSDRQCDGCTACCDGWASGVAHGHTFYPGKKCHYVGETGCTIYEQRPKDPCVNFRCVWVTYKTVPEWMKPNKINAMLVAESVEGIPYVTVKEMGQRLDSRVLSWVVLAVQSNLIPNARYEIDGGWNFIGTPEFRNLMSRPKAEKQL